MGRLHFLIGGVILYALGVVIAAYAGVALNLEAVLWGQIAVTATQLMTHYANDYFDLEVDRFNRTPTHWSGGSRVLVEERLPACTALITALALAGIAFAATLILSIVIRPGIATFILLLTAQLLAWFYSAPPLRLHSRGIGELTTAIIVTLLTPLTGFYLQVGQVSLLPLIAVVPLCCMQFAMLLVIEFPDAEADRQAGKRTLVVRLGPSFAARLYVLLLLMAYIELPFLWLLGLPLAVPLAVAALSPLALWQIGRMRRGDWQNASRWNTLALTNIVLLMATAMAEVAAFTALILN
ncbi:MAG: prenyltransferase [Anaerolineae bacterium]|nr:prenyltransferase [Anaerolineae bacterium]